MLKDGLKLKGKLTIALNDKVVQEVPNLVVTAGKGYVADRMANNSTVIGYMAIGTGSTAAAAGNTALGSESARTALTSTNVSGAVVTYVDTFAAGTGTGAITEAGLLTASSGGTMLARTVFSVVNKGANDAMTITWTVTVS
ncbi:MAG: hypothetical protein Tp172DCM1112201_18 [Prokaryotic dsDNA virus sp.]|nr:MAG: hypothetical protein Tp172DCM1112201_18 [Prokaryotic dsDNA virus sp.]|tara:strand:- start:3144 stop:3566 length:423 start_codon:yes stop_codon:yes gene_type:complete